MNCFLSFFIHICEDESQESWYCSEEKGEKSAENKECSSHLSHCASAEGCESNHMNNVWILRCREHCACNNLQLTCHVRQAVEYRGRPKTVNQHVLCGG